MIQENEEREQSGNQRECAGDKFVLDKDGIEKKDADGAEYEAERGVQKPELRRFEKTEKYGERRKRKGELDNTEYRELHDTPVPFVFAGLADNIRTAGYCHDRGFLLVAAFPRAEWSAQHPPVCDTAPRRSSGAPEKAPRRLF